MRFLPGLERPKREHGPGWLPVRTPNANSLLPVCAVLAFCAGTFDEVRAGANEDLGCSVECPGGSRLSNIEVSEYNTEYARRGTFLYVEESCESFCEPIVPCVLPNVPVVTAEEGFACQPLVGLDAFEPIDDIDFSFAGSWNEAEASIP